MRVRKKTVKEIQNERKGQDKKGRWRRKIKRKGSKR
jgi:hypothetical protein